jgi:hypothetical protein
MLVIIRAQTEPLGAVAAAAPLEVLGAARLVILTLNPEAAVAAILALGVL